MVSIYTKYEFICGLDFDEKPSALIRKALEELGCPYIDKERKCFLVNYWAFEQVLGILEKNDLEIYYGEDFLRDYRVYKRYLDAKKISLERHIENLNKRIFEEHGLKLFDHQILFMRWAGIRNSLLLGDEVGLMKTLSTIGSIPPKNPVLVVGPANSKGVWSKQYKKWVGRESEVLDGRASFRFPKPGEVIITNYDILPADLYDKVPRHTDGTDYTKQERDKFNRELRKRRETLLKQCPRGLAVVADEAHRIKNRKAVRTRRFSYIADAALENGGKVLALTGTPLNNRAGELYSILTTIGALKSTFGNYDNFNREFGGVPTNMGVLWGKPRSTAKYYLANSFLRRTKEEVLDLPPWYPAEINVEVDEATRRVCEEFESILSKLGISIEEAVEMANNPKLKPHFMKLKAQLAIAKIPAVLEKIEDLEDAGELVIVACTHVKPLDFFGERDGWIKITGEVNKPGLRSQIEDDFQAGKYKGLALSTMAGGEALTLTRCCHIITVDKPWTPGALSQVHGRINRQGQTRSMTFWEAKMNHWLEDRIDEILNQKQILIDATIEKVTKMDLSLRTGNLL